MYQADFICTYKMMDEVNDQEQMYRIQLLQAFGLNHWDDEQVIPVIMELYNELEKTNQMKEIYNKARENPIIQEMLTIFSDESLIGDDIILNLLFKFEYFDLLHRCIVDFLINGDIDEKYKNNLLNAL